MCQDQPMFWNEHGERVEVMISTNDASIEDIPRIMREHRDLRKALTISLELLDHIGFTPTDPRDQRCIDFIRRIKKQNPL